MDLYPGENPTPEKVSDEIRNGMIGAAIVAFLAGMGAGLLLAWVL
ncbi:MAG: hypothetical protein AB1698_20940 [Pseudomonadota bacterium]